MWLMYLKVFLVGGSICLIAQLLINYTKIKEQFNEQEIDYLNIGLNNREEKNDNNYSKKLKLSSS